MSTIFTILIAAIILFFVLKFLSGLLRLGIAVVILGVAGYWIYNTFFASGAANIFIK